MEINEVAFSNLCIPCVNSVHKGCSIYGLPSNISPPPPLQNGNGYLELRGKPIFRLRLMMDRQYCFFLVGFSIIASYFCLLTLPSFFPLMVNMATLDTPLDKNGQFQLKYKEKDKLGLLYNHFHLIF